MCFKHTHIDINLIHTTQSHLTKIIQLLNIFCIIHALFLKCFSVKNVPQTCSFLRVCHTLFLMKVNIIDLYENNPKSAVSLEITM